MSLIIMILLLSVLILVHEAGHFFTAKLFGMKVDKFGFGLPIGPTLFERKVGETTICIHAFLLGGYVSFPDDDEDCELPADSEERFMNRPYHQKLAVVSAGVIANVICAFFLVLITAALWGRLPSGEHELYVQEIVAPKEHSVWGSGLQQNDRFYKVNGQEVKNGYSFLTYIKMSKGFDGKTTQELIDANLLQLLKLNPSLAQDELIKSDAKVILPKTNFEGKIQLDKFEAKGAKYPKDEQVMISENAKKLRDNIRLNQGGYYLSTGEYTLNELAEALSDTYHPLELTVIRDGEEVDLKTVYINESGALGVKLKIKEIEVPTKDFVSVLTGSFKYLVDNTYTMLYGLGQIFTGNVPLKDLHGVIAITKIGGDEIANGGIFPGLLLTALISMNLALINFLPIPALDGGHALFMTIEKLSGRKIDEKVAGKIASVFFFLLVLLMVYIIFNDIYALIMHKF